MTQKVISGLKISLLCAAAALLLFLEVIPGRAAGLPAEKKLAPEQREELLRRLEGNLKASKTLQANFVQEKHLSLFRDVLVSSGMLAFAAPSRLRWEITAPFHSLLVMNGRELSKYDFPLGRPRKLNLPASDALYEVLAQIAGLHQGKFSDQAANYEMEIYAGEPIRLVLTPKSRKMRQYIPAIEMKFSAALDSVTAVRINEGGGDFTLILFEDVRLNPELPESLFAPEQAGK